MASELETSSIGNEVSVLRCRISFSFPPSLVLPNLFFYLLLKVYFLKICINGFHCKVNVSIFYVARHWLIPANL